MKFVKETTSKGIQIPSSALKLCGFESGEKAELHAFEDALVVLKGQMTAMELLKAAKALQDLSVELHTHLARVCGQCDDCCGEGICPAEVSEDEGIVLPEGLREEAVLERYGFKRVRFVLANSLKKLGTPELISGEARKWCGRTYVPSDKQYDRYFAVDTAAPLLEAFIAQTMRAYQKLGLFGPEHCVGDRSSLNYEGKVLILSPDTLKESCWSPENMLWYAHDGFGCSPSAIGRSIRCTCLGDGEMTRWDRSEFIGVLDEQYLPDWAAEKLAVLRAPEQERSGGPAMGGMTM